MRRKIRSSQEKSQLSIIIKDLLSGVLSYLGKRNVKKFFPKVAINRGTRRQTEKHGTFCIKTTSGVSKEAGESRLQIATNESVPNIRPLT